MWGSASLPWFGEEGAKIQGVSFRECRDSFAPTCWQQAWRRELEEVGIITDVPPLNLDPVTLKNLVRQGYLPLYIPQDISFAVRRSQLKSQEFRSLRWLKEFGLEDGGVSGGWFFSQKDTTKGRSSGEVGVQVPMGLIAYCTARWFGGLWAKDQMTSEAVLISGPIYQHGLRVSDFMVLNSSLSGKVEVRLALKPLESMPKSPYLLKI